MPLNPLMAPHVMRAFSNMLITQYVEGSWLEQFQSVMIPGGRITRDWFFGLVPAGIPAAKGDIWQEPNTIRPTSDQYFIKVHKVTQKFEFTDLDVEIYAKTGEFDIGKAMLAQDVALSANEIFFLGQNNTNARYADQCNHVRYATGGGSTPILPIVTATVSAGAHATGTHAETDAGRLVRKFTKIPGISDEKLLILYPDIAHEAMAYRRTLADEADKSFETMLREIAPRAIIMKAPDAYLPTHAGEAATTIGTAPTEALHDVVILDTTRIFIGYTVSYKQEHKRDEYEERQKITAVLQFCPLFVPVFNADKTYTAPQGRVTAIIGTK